MGLVAGTKVWSLRLEFLCKIRVHTRGLVPKQVLATSPCDQSPSVYQPLRSLFLGPVRTTLEEFKNAALFLRLGSPFTLIRHGNTFQTGEIWKGWLFVFVWTENIHREPSHPFGIWIKDQISRYFEFLIHARGLLVRGLEPRLRKSLVACSEI